MVRDAHPYCTDRFFGGTPFGTCDSRGGNGPLAIELAESALGHGFDRLCADGSVFQKDGFGDAQQFGLDLVLVGDNATLQNGGGAGLVDDAACHEPSGARLRRGHHLAPLDEGCLDGDGQVVNLCLEAFVRICCVIHFHVLNLKNKRCQKMTNDRNLSKNIARPGLGLSFMPSFFIFERNEASIDAHIPLFCSLRVRSRACG